MAAWAWFSGQPGLAGHRFLRRPWTAEMSFKRAREELAAWRQRLRLVESLGPGIERTWLADGPASGFDFVALRTVDDFIAESEALENCLDQYADQLHTGLTAVFSIRKGARRVACVEIGLHEEEVTMPTIVQLRAARNRRAPPEVWQATFSWLGSQRLEPLSPLRHAPKPMKRIEARRKLWSPYLQMLAGTRYELAFRRAVSRAARPAGQDRRARPQRVGLSCSDRPPPTYACRKPQPRRPLHWLPRTSDPEPERRALWRTTPSRAPPFPSILAGAGSSQQVTSEPVCLGRTNAMTRFLRYLSAATALALPATGAAFAQSVELRYATSAPPKTVWEMQVQRFQKQVEDGSKGSLKINAFLNSQLGSEQDTVQQVARGRIDSGGYSVTAGSLLVPEISLLSIPFLFKDQKEQDCVYDNHLTKLTQDMFLKKGVVMLGWSEVGVADIIGKKPFITPDDLKGLKARSAPNKVAAFMWSQFGANPNPLPVTEWNSAFQTGLIDVADSAPTFYFFSGLSKLAPVVTMTQQPTRAASCSSTRRPTTSCRPTTRPCSRVPRPPRRLPCCARRCAASKARSARCTRPAAAPSSS